MVYNPRMSLAPSSSQQGGGAASSTNRNQRRPRDDDVNSFMRLPDEEIVGCITDIGITFTTQDLHKPNPVQIQQIYEWFAELLLNATRATVEPAMRAAAEDVGGEFADSSFPHETRNLLGFYMSLRTLLEEVGVPDFCFADLYKPTYERLNKIFSYVINFVRFRESQAAVIDRHFDRGQSIKNRIADLHQLNHDAGERLAHAKRNRRAMEAQVRDKTARNEELKRQLLDLRRNQERVAARLEDGKAKKNELTAALEDKAAQRLALRHEVGKLRPYTLQSPQALQQSLADLTATLAADRAHIDALDRRARGLQTSADSFGVVVGDVAGLLRLLDDVAAELAKEDDESAKNSRQRDALSERGNNVREVERAETLLLRQLQKWTERTGKLRDTSAAKATEAKDKTAELRRLHKQLTDERTEKNREIERRRVRIEQTEKKMLDLKENIENEVHSAYDEYLKMEAHIKLYMTEMEQTLPSA